MTELGDPKEYDSISKILDEEYPDSALIFTSAQNNKEDIEYFNSKIEHIKKHNDKISSPIGVLLGAGRCGRCKNCSNDFEVQLRPMGRIERVGESCVISDLNEFMKGQDGLGEKGKVKS